MRAYVLAGVLALAAALEMDGTTVGLGGGNAPPTWPLGSGLGTPTAVAAVNPKP